MDFQKFVDTFEPMTCILSVQVFPDGHYGNIRILCGNKAYIHSIENPENLAFSGMLNNKFIPDSPYELYIPKDLNFEDMCYRCAVLKTPFHSYIQPERYNFWIDLYLMPLASDKENIYYCSYSQELTSGASSTRMSNIDADVSSAVLETCIKLRGAKDYNNTMDDVINDIGKQCDAERVCLILTNMKKRTFSVLSESNDVINPAFSVKRHLREDYDDFFSIIETWDDTISGSTGLIIQNQSDMDVLYERNPVWGSSLKFADVKSLVLYPLRYNEETLGYIWAINFNTDKAPKIRAILESTTYFIASEIANHHLMDQLITMGETDMLTGVKNRNAMNRKIDNYIEGKEFISKNIAVIFADLNGLKQVNDSGGHAQGDKLLIQAANILKMAFPDCDIYRAGGDEFMVLATEISEKELEETLEGLKDYRGNPENVSFSLGYYYTEDDFDIRIAMSTADKRMYDDKQLYYEKYPERRRK